MKSFKFGGYGVDVRIRGEWEPDVYWDKRLAPSGYRRFNSYVLVEGNESIPGNVQDTDGNRFSIVSVSGMGEIRWIAGPREGELWPWLLEAFDVTEVQDDA